MKWVNLDKIYFDQHAAILEIDRIDTVNYHEVIGLLDRYRESTDADELQRAIRAVLNKARPELNDARIWFISFDLPRASWAIGVEHNSLPVNVLGCELHRLPLVPESTLAN